MTLCGVFKVKLCQMTSDCVRGILVMLCGVCKVKLCQKNSG